MFFPAYNEEKNIPKLVKAAAKVLREVANKYEIIIVVYEGSTDNTIGIVNYSKKSGKYIRLILQPKNKKGVGYAKILGFKKDLDKLAEVSWKEEKTIIKEPIRLFMLFFWSWEVSKKIGISAVEAVKRSMNV